MSLTFYTDDRRVVSWQSDSGEPPSDSLKYGNETGLNITGLPL